MDRKNYYELLGLPFDGSLEGRAKVGRTDTLDKMIDSALTVWRDKLISDKARATDKAKISQIEEQLAKEAELRRAMLGREGTSPEGMVEAAIRKWKSRLESQKAGGAAAGDPAKRAQIDAELALEADIRAVMLDKKSRRSEAADMIEKCCGKLSQLLDIQTYGQSELPDVTEVQVKNVAQRLGLPYDKAAEVYESKGIKVIKPRKAADLKKYFLDDATFENLQKLFDKLHNDKWIKGTPYESAAKADDLYSLACLLDGGREKEVSVYRKKPTKTLKDIMDKFSVRLASDSGSRSYAAILRDLVSIGASRVFDSEEDRERYAHSVKKEELSEFFSLLRQAPLDFKKDRDFAENCIKRIQSHFPDYSIALALYNEKAGLGRDPYVRQEAAVGVVCECCGSYSEYPTVAQASKAICPACGAALYISCPSCAKKVPASAERCGCGFEIGKLKHIGSFITGAQSAIDRLDFKEAEYFISNIESADPKNKELANLRKLYTDKTAVYKKPLAELDALISSRKFMAAQRKTEELAAKMKELDLESRRDSIRGQIDKAAALMPKAGVSETQRGNSCYEALSICADYRPALDMIATVKLNAPTGLKVSVTDHGCELIWQRGQDLGVGYRIVRKQGALPAAISDGETVAKEVSGVSFTDESLRFGIKYGYAVFAERMGVFSEPATVWAEVLGELDKGLSYGCVSGRCSFSWVLPENALGIRVIKKQGTLPPETPDKGCEVFEQRGSGFTDTQVQDGISYGYRLQCIYQGEKGERYSRGLTLTLRPEPMPQEPEGLSIKQKGTALEAKWKADDSSVKISILRLENKQVFMEAGEVCAVSELDAKLGRFETLVTADMAAGRCGVTLPKNRMLNTALITRSGSSARLCRVMSVSTAAPLQIDPVNTVIKNNILTIKLKELPEGLERVHYCALTKTSSAVPWADTADIGTSKLTAIAAAELAAGGAITADAPQEDIYITVIGEYGTGGNVIYSQPAKLKRNNSPRARISYKLGTSLIGDKHSLRIKAECGSLPEMYLVYSKSGVPTDIASGDTVTVMTIAAAANANTKGYSDIPLTKEVWDSIPAGAKIRLLIDKADTFDYEMSPKEVGSLKK